MAHLLAENGSLQFGSIKIGWQKHGQLCGVEETKCPCLRMKKISRGDSLSFPD